MKYIAYICEENNQVFIYSDCVDKFYDIIKGEIICDELDIVCKNKINDIDLSFIGHLILLKKALPKMNINFYLPYNNIDEGSSGEVSGVLWKIKQSMVHANLTTDDNVFKIIDSDGRVLDADAKLKEWFVLSSKFMPIIYLNENNYKNTFENKSSCIDYNDLKKIYCDIISTHKEPITEEWLYQFSRSYLFEKISRDNYVEVLSMLALFRSLRDVRLIRYFYNEYVYEFAFNDSNIGYVVNKELKDKYWRVLRNLYEEIIQKPPIYNFVFSILITSALRHSKIYNNNIQSICDKVVGIWSFVKELAACRT